MLPPSRRALICSIYAIFRAAVVSGDPSNSSAANGNRKAFEPTCLSVYMRPMVGTPVRKDMPAQVDCTSSKRCYRRFINPAAKPTAAAKKTPTSATVEQMLTNFVCMNSLQQIGDRYSNRPIATLSDRKLRNLL
jgi:hypothetical protein